MTGKVRRPAHERWAINADDWKAATAGGYECTVMRPPAAWMVLAPCLLLVACATLLERPIAPFESKVLDLAPGAPYETCMHLLAGERLFFSYKADPPMAFSIQRRVAGATLSYVLRELSRDEGGVFFVPQTEDYCLRWMPSPDEVPWPTLLRFKVQLNPGG